MGKGTLHIVLSKSVEDRLDAWFSEDGNQRVVSKRTNARTNARTNEGKGRGRLTEVYFFAEHGVVMRW